MNTNTDVVVQPAVPILYFGDRQAYHTSSTRLVTVALNPSKAEFPPESPYVRFPRAEGHSEPSDDYLSALDAYFVTQPYRSWFSSFEPVLNGADASYYPGRTNTALHTDICSPVATDPTWSKLDGETRRNLISAGAPLWHDLIRTLKPHVILVSLARHHLDKIEFPSKDRFELARLDEGRKYPYVTTAQRVDIDGHESLLVFGRAANQPFGSITKSYRSEIGGLIAKVLGA